MFCTHCGASLQADQRFCGSCGTIGGCAWFRSDQSGNARSSNVGECASNWVASRGMCGCLAFFGSRFQRFISCAAAVACSARGWWDLWREAGPTMCHGAGRWVTLSPRSYPLWV